MSTLKSLSFKKDNRSGSIKFHDVSGDVQVTISGYNFVTRALDFHQVKKLYWWLDGWMDKERDECLNGCDHERSGCQYHDADYDETN